VEHEGPIHLGAIVRIGVYITEGTSLADLTDQARAAADAGADGAFFAQLFSWDAVTAAAVVGARVPGIELGTAIAPTYPRHPLAFAGQVLTAQAATDNRLTLGIGPSHRPIIEGQFGYSFDRPARHVREYLEALLPLLRGEPVAVHGEAVTAVGQVDVPGAATPPVLLAALGPTMLRLAGEHTDGTVTVWVGPRLIEEAIAPAINRAAADAGRGAPRIVAGVVLCVTSRPEEIIGQLAAQVAPASQFPSYRSLLERQGLTSVHETSAIGDEALIAGTVRRYAAAGTTDLLVSLRGDEAERKRTLMLVTSLRDQL
jgi:F420-dependent oxidoreductase-like protein